MPSHRFITGLTIIGLLGPLACGESRQARLQRELGYDKKEEKQREKVDAEIPPHPTREKLAPLLTKLYSQNKLPDVVEASIDTSGEYRYELTPGVVAVVRIAQGLSMEEQVRAIVTGTAEADAWAYRPNARRPYAEQVHRVMRGYGDDQKELILKAYADLALLDFFNGPDADAAIAALPADVKPTVDAMRQEYVQGKDKVWAKWMNVKMYARRVVSGDEPFRPVLRAIQKELGKEEPPPRAWLDSMDAPFKGWAQDIVKNEELLTKLSNLPEMVRREEYLNDTHSLWVMEGSEMMPEKAKDVKPEPELGFGVLREDLGGGYNELTFVFSRKLSGSALKKAFLRSVIYGHMLSDFQMLSTAGSDFAERDEEGRIDPQTSVVPDKYDPLYAKCGSGAALDTLVVNYRSKFPILADVKPNHGKPEQALNSAHECVIKGAAGEIHIPAKDDDKDVEGPAPGSRLAIYQMLARFENIDVAAMGADKRLPEDDVIDEAEAALKAIKAKQAAEAKE